jgi:hypothetical protein
VIKALLVLLFATSSLQAQKGSVFGVVRDSATGAPIHGASVALAGTGNEARVAPDGAYRMANLPPGSHIVRARALGYRPRDVQIVVSGEAQRVDFLLSPLAVTLEEMVVTPGRYTLLDEPVEQQTTLSREDLQTMPQIGEDIYRAVNRLPGMASNELSAKFWVRGGSDEELLVRLDGLEMYEPFHLKDFDGSLSIVDVQAVSGVELLTGGFSADYGNRLTGVFNLQTSRDPVSGFHPSAGLSIGNARLAAKGGFAKGKGQWMASVRRGYVDVVLNLFNILDPGEDLSPRYYDGFATLRYRFNDRHTLSFNLLRADDRTTFTRDFAPTLRSTYGSGYAWTTWRAEFTPRLRAETALSVGRLTWQRGGAGLRGTLDSISVAEDRWFRFAGVRQDWSVSLSDRMVLRLGGEAKAMDTDYQYLGWQQRRELINGVVIRLTDSTRAALDPIGSTLGAFAAWRVRPWSPLTLELGGRVDRQSYIVETTWSPRISAAYALSSSTTIRAAWGHYYQPQQLFQLDIRDGDTRFYRSELAEHRTIGVDHHFANGVSVTVEAYQRRLSRLRPRSVNLENDRNPFAELEGDRIILLPTSGEARGLEAFVRRRGGARWDWSASYSLARVQDKIGGTDVPRKLDQRHTLYLELGYRPSAAWSLSAAWQFHTGWPYTPSEFRLVPVAGGGQAISHNYGAINSVRLPAYHRADVRVSRRFRVGRGELQAFVDVFNAYDRSNPQAYEYDLQFTNGMLQTQRVVDALLPILPTFGVNVEF